MCVCVCVCVCVFVPSLYVRPCICVRHYLCVRPTCRSYLCVRPTCVYAPTCVYTNPKLQLCMRHVFDAERFQGAKDIQRHGTDLASVLVSVPVRETRDHHISVSDCLHLKHRYLNLLAYRMFLENSVSKWKWCFMPQFCTVRLHWAGFNLG